MCHLLVNIPLYYYLVSQTTSWENYCNKSWNKGTSKQQEVTLHELPTFSFALG